MVRDEVLYVEVWRITGSETNLNSTKLYVTTFPLMLAPYQLKPPHIILLLLVIQFSTINVLISNFASAADLNSQQLVLLDFLEYVTVIQVFCIYYAHSTEWVHKSLLLTGTSFFRQIPGLQSRWDIQTIHSYCSWCVEFLRALVHDFNRADSFQLDATAGLELRVLMTTPILLVSYFHTLLNRGGRYPHR